MKRYVTLRSESLFNFEVIGMNGHSYKQVFGVFTKKEGGTYFLYSRETGEPLTLGDAKDSWCFYDNEVKDMSPIKKAAYKALRKVWKEKQRAKG